MSYDKSDSNAVYLVFFNRRRQSLREFGTFEFGTFLKGNHLYNFRLAFSVQLFLSTLK